MKKSYEAPEVKALGTFESLTQAASDGAATDAVFSNDTPRGDLTFS